MINYMQFYGFKQLIIIIDKQLTILKMNIFQIII